MGADPISDPLPQLSRYLLGFFSVHLGATRILAPTWDHFDMTVRFVFLDGDLRVGPLGPTGGNLMAFKR